MNINKVSYVREVELIYRKTNQQVIQVSTPAQVTEFLISKSGFSPVERFHCLCINNKNVVVSHRVISQGTVTETIVHPREVFIEAIISQASGIIVAHNHPSGTMTLSSNDIETTKRLMEVGKIIGIPLVDHIIFTGMNDVQNYISMKEHGYIP